MKSTLFLRTIELYNLSSLIAHEEVNSQHTQQMISEISARGLMYPIVIDKKSKVILDGHHRWTALKKLGATHVPAVAIDYSDARVVVESWKGVKKTKQQIVTSAKQGNLFPPKTTKHLIKQNDQQQHISSGLSPSPYTLQELTKP